MQVVRTVAILTGGERSRSTDAGLGRELRMHSRKTTRATLMQSSITHLFRRLTVMHGNVLPVHHHQCYAPTPLAVVAPDPLVFGKSFGKPSCWLTHPTKRVFAVSKPPDVWNGRLVVTHASRMEKDRPLFAPRSGLLGYWRIDYHCGA